MKHLFITIFLSVIAVNLYAQSTDTTKKAPLKGWTVMPAKLTFNLDKGAVSSQTLNIINSSDQVFKLNLELIDWLRDSTGEHVYFPTGSFGHSCASWVKFDKTYVELKPGESQSVVVTMNVPDSDSAVAEMKWTMLLVKTVGEKEATKKGGVQAEVTKSSGIGVHVYQTPPNVQSKELKMLSFSQIGDSLFQIASRNLGGTQVSATYSIELSSQATGEKITLGPKSVPLFPAQKRNVEFALPATLTKGKYTAVALIDVGDDDVPLEAAQKEIEVR